MDLGSQRDRKIVAVDYIETIKSCKSTGVATHYYVRYNSMFVSLLLINH